MSRGEVPVLDSALTGAMEALPDDHLRLIDPASMNLEVAQGVPALVELEVGSYVAAVDEWAADAGRRLPGMEQHFWASPDDWKGDVAFFRLGMLCWYLGEVLGVRYKEDQASLTSVAYTNPSDLFLNGLIDTRRGTCGNLPVLYLAIARRLGWPVYLIIAGSHALCRYHDGMVTHNIECTNFEGGFRSPPDEYLKETYGIPDEALAAGSDLCSLTPRQTLGWYIGLRGRHHLDCGRYEMAAADYRLALTLFPQSRRLRGDLAGAQWLAGEPAGSNSISSPSSWQYSPNFTVACSLNLVPRYRRDVGSEVVRNQ